MIHVYYHYHSMTSRRASRFKLFATRKDADRWIFCMGRKYPKFQLDEIFEV